MTCKCSQCPAKEWKISCTLPKCTCGFCPNYPIRKAKIKAGDDPVKLLFLQNQ